MTTDEIAAFWARSRRALADREPNLPAEDDPPPAWAFGATPEQADESLRLVIDGIKTATCCPMRDYQAEDEPVPQVGTLSIVLDGSGRPRALVRDVEVRLVRFDRVDAEHAHAEGEGDRSLAHWQAVHEWFFTEYDSNVRGFSRDMVLVLERFELLVSEPGTGRSAAAQDVLGAARGTSVPVSATGLGGGEGSTSLDAARG